MKNRRFYLHIIQILIPILTLAFSACSPQVPVPVVTNRRAPTDVIPGSMLNQISVEDLRVTCDIMARDLIQQEFIYTKKAIPIVAVKPLENKTDLVIDPDIFQKTIRVKLMEHSGGRILFRDEESYRYTLDERMKQSGDKVQISSTTTHTRTQSPTTVGQPLNVQVQEQKKTTTIDEDKIEKKVADVDYFLTGLIYSTIEVTQTSALRGMRYFQFQFRVTDSQTNIIMWEKEYLVKRHGSFK